jgi:hypothetical protein
MNTTIQSIPFDIDDEEAALALLVTPPLLLSLSSLSSSFLSFLTALRRISSRASGVWLERICRVSDDDDDDDDVYFKQITARVS